MVKYVKVKILRVRLQKFEPVWLRKSCGTKFSSCHSIGYFTEGCKALRDSPKRENSNHRNNVKFESV